MGPRIEGMPPEDSELASLEADARTRGSGLIRTPCGADCRACHRAMTPVIWLDDARRRRPTIPVPDAVVRPRQREKHFVRQPDWRPFQVERAPSWCGHTIPKIYLPAGHGWWQEVLVWEPGGAAAESPGACAGEVPVTRLGPR